MGWMRRSFVWSSGLGMVASAVSAGLEWMMGYPDRAAIWLVAMIWAAACLAGDCQDRQKRG